MKKLDTKKRIFSLLLVLSYLVSGCGMQEKNTNNQSDIDEEKQHELNVNEMEKYKKNAFIKDFEMYNDTYPEFYVNGENQFCSGVLTDDFSNLMGHEFSIAHYYLHLIDKYEAKEYEVDEKGNLIFHWSDERFVGDFDTTIFSYKKQDDEENFGIEGKNFFIADQKNGKTVVSRHIQDLDDDIRNEIIIEKDLSEDVHATISAKHRIFSPYIDNTDKSLAYFNDFYETELSIDYYGKIYTFYYDVVKLGNIVTYHISLPGDITFDEEKMSGVSSPDDSKDFDDYYNLTGLICRDHNYEEGKNIKAIAYFEKFLAKIECLNLFAQGFQENPWYTYVEKLIDSENYQTALEIMQSEGTFWKPQTLERSK